MAQVADSMIMVVRHDTVRAGRILEALDSLRYPGGAKLIGCVLNAVPDAWSDYGYGYRYSHYSYKYGYGHYGKYGYGVKKQEKTDENQVEIISDEYDEAGTSQEREE